MPTVKFKDVNIYYSEQGTGSSIILLHGFLEASWMWKGVTPELSKKYRVIEIDLPGHGKSDCIGYVHTMEEMAEAVFAVIQALGLRRVSIVGHSMGGYVSLAFAEQYPDHVKNLILLNSTALADSEAQKANRLRAIDLVKTNHKSFVRKSVPRLFRPVNRTKFREELRWVKEKCLETSAQGIVAALEGMRLRPNREILLKFPPYPVHIIAGTKDPRISIEESRYLASISENVALYELKGCGHMSYVECPTEMLKALKKALA